MRTSLKVAIGTALVAVAVVAVTLNALGDDGAVRPSSDGATSDDGMAMCVEGVPDCDDMVVIPGGDEPVSDDGSEEPMDPAPEPDVVEPNPDAVNLRARPFDTATAGDDGRTIMIDFVSGVEPCYVLGRIDIDEGPRAVTITLHDGNLPSDGDVACIDIGVLKRTTVTLDEPLGDREIVDGAA
jgi:hypothetical protein